MTNRRSRSRRAQDRVVRALNTEPSWWKEDLLSGLVIAAGVGFVTFVGQLHFDDLRDARAQRLEDLRFVRDRSAEGYLPRPFQGVDLEGQNLNGLRLEAADFQFAKLSNVRLIGTFLGNANFHEADLRGAELYGAQFYNATLMDADLRGVKGLETVGLENICYDHRTQWPEGFTPLPSRTDNCPP
ncbi:pentapeptide repeat-containing protein [Rhodococcus indonesiensis]|uniref:pentapeptide repeat-containing protein n=1 Tax=Rhodococcus indonesiensis TaxID=3055869 RepID=UPI0034DE5282